MKIDDALLSRQLSAPERAALGRVAAAYDDGVVLKLGPNFSIDPATGHMNGFRATMPATTPVERSLFVGAHAHTIAVYAVKPGAAPSAAAAAAAPAAAATPGLEVHRDGRYALGAAEPGLGPSGFAGVFAQSSHNPETDVKTIEHAVVVSASQDKINHQAQALLAHAQAAGMTIGELLASTQVVPGVGARGADLLAAGEIAQRANERLAVATAKANGLTLAEMRTDTHAAGALVKRAVPISAAVSRVFRVQNDTVVYESDMVTPAASPHVMIGHLAKGVKLIGAPRDDKPFGVGSAAAHDALPTGAPIQTYAHALSTADLVTAPSEQFVWDGPSTHLLAHAHVGHPDEAALFINATVHAADTAAYIAGRAATDSRTAHLLPVRVTCAAAPKRLAIFDGDEIGQHTVQIAAQPPRFDW